MFAKPLLVIVPSVGAAVLVTVRMGYAPAVTVKPATYATVKPLALTSDVAVTRAKLVVLSGRTCKTLPAALNVNALTLPVMADPPPNLAPLATVKFVLAPVNSTTTGVTVLIDVKVDELPVSVMVPEPPYAASSRVNAPVIVPEIVPDAP